jgi:hypothetical protein
MVEWPVTGAGMHYKRTSSRWDGRCEPLGTLPPSIVKFVNQRREAMSTRALYTFTDERCSYNVYKHCDGYPSGAAQALKTALTWFAWQLPRFEADEFAAAFCTAGKLDWDYNIDGKEIALWAKERGPEAQSRPWHGGNVRLMPQGKPTTVACRNCSDIEYRYELKMAVTLPNHIESTAKKKNVQPQLCITAYSGNWWDNKPTEEVIFTGPFDEFYTWALAKDKEQAA